MSDPVLRPSPASGALPACAERGYCGPFHGEERYQARGGASAGLGDCVHCGRPVRVADELEKWERELWLLRFRIRLE